MNIRTPATFLVMSWMFLSFQSITSAQANCIVLNEPAIPGSLRNSIKILTTIIHQAGYNPEILNAQEAAESNILSTKRCFLLILPNANNLPASLYAPISEYLKNGGNILTFGGELGAVPYLRSGDGKWRTYDQMEESQALIPPQESILNIRDFKLPSGWFRSTNHPKSVMLPQIVMARTSFQTSPALKIEIDNLDGWDTFLSPILSSPFHSGNSLTVLSAKGDADTNSLAIEWDERDGSRWIAVIPLHLQWRRYILPPSSFHFFDGPGSRRDTAFIPANAVRCSVGEAFGLTDNRQGRYSYEIAGLGTGSLKQMGSAAAYVPHLPALDLLSPRYKFFDIHPPARMRLLSGKYIADLTASSPEHHLLLSPQPRPSGAGFNKLRDWRMIPLITAIDVSNKEWRGTPAAMKLFRPGTSYGGARLFFSLPAQAILRNRQTVSLLLNTLRRLHRGLFLLEGGSAYYTLFPGQSVTLGAEAMDLNTVRSQKTDIKIELVVSTHSGRIVWKRIWTVNAAPKHIDQVSENWKPPDQWPVGGYRIETKLWNQGKLLDSISQGLHVWNPPSHPHYTTIGASGLFFRNGKTWRINGVNYMPSSGIGQNHGELFEHWLSSQAYSPEIVSRDLHHIKNLGMNAVSIFLYTDDIQAQNLLDILRQCRDLRIYVNLSLRPDIITYLDKGRIYADEQAWRNYRSIITYYHLQENDTVYAYEIDWEPAFGGYDRRSLMDPDWRAWVTDKYGSVSKAEISWEISAPRNQGGELTGPSDAQLSSQGGADTKLCADYRHFLDHWLEMTYGTITRKLHALDPHHLVSFRMTSAGNPADTNPGYAEYQLEGLSHSVDFLSPECYGRVGDPLGNESLHFEIAYARAIDPDEPFIWAETGVSAWMGGVDGGDTASSLQEQGIYYKTLYKYSIDAGADGIVFWWYPGGYRVNENSDYGMINPDGTDRPATKVIRKYGALFLHSPFPPEPDKVFLFNRDAHPDGIVGIYRDLAQSFEKALKDGYHPGLKAEH